MKGKHLEFIQPNKLSFLKPKFKPDETQFTHPAHIQYFNKFNSIKIMPICLQLCGCRGVNNKDKKKRAAQ